MDKQMIYIWQMLVQPDDDVWILGDVSWHWQKKTNQILDQLPGRKYLIWGNHDENLREDSRFLNHFMWTGERKEIVIDGQKVVLDHYPILEWHGYWKGAFHFHGHTHGNRVIAGRGLDVGIDGPLGNGDCRLYSWNECRDYCASRKNV